MTAQRLLSTGWRAALLPVALIGLAQLAATATALESDSLASPFDIAKAFFSVVADGSLLRATADTLKAAAAGCLLGVGAGSLLGIVLGLSRIADDALDLTIELLRPIPVVALIPVVMMLLGFGAEMEIVIIALGMLWPSVLLARAAVKEVEPRLIEVSSVLQLGFAARLGKIVLPAILPQLFMSLKLAAGYALVVAVTVEITANPLGLGYGIMMAQQALRPAEMFAYLIWIGAIGWLISLLLNAAQRAFFPAFVKGEGR
ncbi:ABC transporter permease [Rhizobium anhuiense]|uniref:ABC transporter permease subunit n=1 Tax=Rhizobium anhuiense TaxID=1184720 RepID=A0A3S0Q182_9HYPH|nr:ABC transporter permease subunit [Rhizobium anhuiense]RUL96085.1 ABC transporter permease subunit [Rhizobium anhuiense]UTS89127.1 ABC transporter permease subunit [Rhizobium anhuiense bv. trifolii]GGE10095.1 sulfonate ABC transporter, permease protein SsuC [Rhizobium anhuiense]